MNAFYKQPIPLQWLVAIILLLAGLFPGFVLIEWGYDQPLYYLLFLLFIPIAQFSSAPLFKLSGIYTYYSPMLIGYMANQTHIDLHSGGSFDYLFVMRKFKKGVETRNRILAYHLEGLLHIIQRIEDGTVPPTVNIVATSYFFNERTIQKFGFEQQKPSLFYRLNLLINFIDLFWMYSVSQGRFSIPTIWRAKKVSIEGAALVAKKELIAGYYQKLMRKVNDSVSK